jgi:flagellar motility protein MotE (MotC chaperone)
MNHTLPLLLAAPGWQEIFSVFAAIVFFVVWLVNQISDAKKQQRARDQVSVEPPQPSEERGAAPPASQADPLRAQVDDFLRRAGKQPAVQRAVPTAQQRKPAGREEIVVLLDDSVAAPQRQASIERKKLPSAMLAPPRSAPKPRGGKLRPQSVSEHVAGHSGASTQQFREEVADLGERVKQADEQFDRQLNQKFDHKLGTLGSRSSASDQPVESVAATPAANIAAMLASPAGVQQAIIINEILRRPTDRW